METTYAQKNDTVQKASANNAESVVDSSSQSATLQRHAALADVVAQRAPEPRPNNTGLPDDLKNGVESLSGYSLDNVRVHYNSPKPATVQALAYTQGTDIHVAPGQEHTLPHEAWHVAQQMAGRVSPTTNINGMPVNDNAGLEHEADVMGEKAVQCKMPKNAETIQCKEGKGGVVQCEEYLLIANSSQKGKGSKVKDEKKKVEFPRCRKSHPGNYNPKYKYGGKIYTNDAPTFHHIYPKSKLEMLLREIFIAIESIGAMKTKTKDLAKKNDLTIVEDKLQKLIRICYANDDEKVNEKFYWNPGIGFWGPAPEDRLDDPGSDGVESKPKNMDSEKYESVINWARNFELLNQSLLSESYDTYIIDSCFEMQKKMNKVGVVYESIPPFECDDGKFSLISNSDWNVAATGEMTSLRLGKKFFLKQGTSSKKALREDVLKKDVEDKNYENMFYEIITNAELSYENFNERMPDQINEERKIKLYKLYYIRNKNNMSRDQRLDIAFKIKGTVRKDSSFLKT